MPRARQVINAFTAKEVFEITGLSRPMIDYLSRSDFLQPAYAETGSRVRGRVRYYSYRDLVVARIVQRLRENGVELSRLKDAIKALATDPALVADDPRGGLGWLMTDGREVYLRATDGFLDDLGAGGQRAFAFVVDTGKIGEEVKARLPQAKVAAFSMRNAPLDYVDALERASAAS